jgi:PST family polysaccharide transporter
MGLLVFLALTSPLMTIHLVPLSRLESDLRFRQVAFVNTLSGASATMLAVLCAALGLGAFSLIVPRAVVALGSAAALFWIAKPRIRWSIDAARWSYLLSGGGLLLLSSLAALIVSYGDYAVVGRLLGTGAVGLYYFAFGLSTQTGVLLTDNLGRVLLPTLSGLLGQPELRQRAAFVRSCRLLALLGVPLCLLQAAVAGPLVRLLFGPRWAAAIPILQLLSVGMTGQLLSMPSQTLLKAQGRLRTLLVVSTVAAGCFLTAVTFAAARGGLIVATATIAAYYLVAGLAQLEVSLRAVGGRWRDLAHICTAAFAVGAASATLAWASGQLLPAGRVYDLLRLAVIPGVGLGLHALCLRVFVHDAWRDLRATIDAVAGRTLPPGRAPGGD